MPLAFVEDISGIRCGVWRVEEDFGELAGLLDDDEAVARIRSEAASDKRRRERLSVTLLLRSLTGGKEFVEHDAEGRPFLAGAERFISVSHCPGYAAVCIASFPLGVDIERVSDRQFFVADKFLLPSEKACLSQSRNSPKEGAALLWSVKEAVYKLVSDESLHLGSDICVADFTLSDKGMLYADITLGTGMKTASASYRFFKNTVLVVSKYR